MVLTIREKKLFLAGEEDEFDYSDILRNEKGLSQSWFIKMYDVFLVFYIVFLIWNFRSVIDDKKSNIYDDLF
jgi:hypothetical protein